MRRWWRDEPDESNKRYRKIGRYLARRDPKPPPGDVCPICRSNRIERHQAPEALGRGSQRIPNILWHCKCERCGYTWGVLVQPVLPVGTKEAIGDQGS